MKKVFGMSKENTAGYEEVDVEEGMPLTGGQPSYAPQGQPPMPIISPHNSGPHISMPISSAHNSTGPHVSMPISSAHSSAHNSVPYTQPVMDPMQQQQMQQQQ